MALVNVKKVKKVNARQVRAVTKAAKDTVAQDVVPAVQEVQAINTRYGTPKPSKNRVARIEKALKIISKNYGGGIGGRSHYSTDDAAALVRAVGGTTSKILGESSGNPKAIGHDPGGTTGLGLWQMTTGVGNDDLIARHGGPDAMLKPKPNAKAALELYRGGGLANWYAPSSAPGDPAKAHVKPNPKAEHARAFLAKAGVQVPKKKASTKVSGTVPSVVKIGKQIAEKKFGLTVGENPAFGGVDPVHVTGSYHYQRDAKGRGEAIDVSGPSDKMAAFDKYMAKTYGPGLTELFYDPGISLKDGQPIGDIGGHSDHVHVAVEKPGAHFSGTTGGFASGGGVSSGGGGGSTGSSGSSQGSNKSALSAKEKKQRKLAAITSIYKGSTSTPTVSVSALARKVGSRASTSVRRKSPVL